MLEHYVHTGASAEHYVPVHSGEGRRGGSVADARYRDLPRHAHHDERAEGSFWRLYSSAAFDGTVGLDFFLDRRLTLDYRGKRVAKAESGAPAELDRSRYITVELLTPPKSQGRILYTRA